MAAGLGHDLQMIESVPHVHTTPWGSMQSSSQPKPDHARRLNKFSLVTINAGLSIIHVALSRRRYRGTPGPRATAEEQAQSLSLTKTVELENRITRIEAAALEIGDRIEGIHKRQIAIQAQLDHLGARVGLI